jgi:hypothetical protein
MRPFVRGTNTDRVISQFLRGHWVILCTLDSDKLLNEIFSVLRSTDLG